MRLFYAAVHVYVYVYVYVPDRTVLYLLDSTSPEHFCCTYIVLYQCVNCICLIVSPFITVYELLCYVLYCQIEQVLDPTVHVLYWLDCISPGQQHLLYLYFTVLSIVLYVYCTVLCIALYVYCTFLFVYCTVQHVFFLLHKSQSVPSLGELYCI